MAIMAVYLAGVLSTIAAWHAMAAVAERREKYDRERNRRETIDAINAGKMCIGEIRGCSGGWNCTSDHK